MWFVLRHLNLVHFVDISCESLKLLFEFIFLCFSLHGILPKWVQYMHCNHFIDHLYTLFLSSCHVIICVFYLRNDLHYLLLEWFHLSLALLLLCLCGYELYLQLLHILRSFDTLSDRDCLLPLLEVLDSCAYPIIFWVPLLDLLILLHLHP